MNSSSEIRLETPRLVLRTFTEQDAVTFSEYRSDPEVACYQGWDAPYPLEKALQFAREMAAVRPGAPGEWLQLAVEMKSDGKMIGDVAFKILRHEPLQAEIGYTLARAYQGRGYGTEAVSRLLDFLFVEFKLHRVFANCDPENAASIALLKKVGMRHEGRFIESLWFKGRWANEDWYAILREEWPGLGSD